MLAPPHTRDGLGYLLEAEGLKAGAELGVQRGQFARLTLDRWPSCTQYILVDVWKQQENYVEGANVDNNQQEEIYQAAIAAVEPHKAKVKVMRMFTNEAALQVAIESLDYVYVDARHDYCGCLEDMEMWWPKLKPGAIMAGHDYLNVAEQKEVTPDEDWGICMDGSRNEGAVKGAVANFAQRYGLTVAVTYAEGHPFRTWLLRKPKC
ncbi:O-methyltransferase [Micractinium conductrix]|uniref:O-methyltransferase n=1 Tax=Micractinium conductrix TaxID=554055 RepID=A0A2P6UZM8_9CHLO|nr:O-methyltransferase [Micractinium conductrix]|eukprot:PSC67295.1 O-methyltransferase [Micractinium conductrix]